jgi:hypothetical protein
VSPSVLHHHLSRDQACAVKPHSTLMLSKHLSGRYTGGGNTALYINDTIR